MAANDFWQKYHLASQTSLTEPIRTPMHVVVTHKDAVGGRADVRDFLASNGYRMLVSSIESNFSTVSYHMCDATKGSEAAGVLSLVFEGIDKEVADILKKA